MGDLSFSWLDIISKMELMDTDKPNISFCERIERNIGFIIEVHG